MTIKFSQLDTLSATSITDNTILPVVDTTGTFVNKKIVAGSLKTFLSNIGTSANLNINSTLTPNVGGLYDIGTTSYKFGNLFLSGNTIQLGASTVLTAGPASSGLTISGNLVAPFFTGVLITAAQPNITSIGTQTQLTMGGNLVLNSSAKLVLGADPGVSGYYLRSGGPTSAPTWSSTSGFVSGFSGNISGGSAGSVPYQLGVNTTAFLGIGTAGFMLTSTGSAPSWVNPGSIIVNTANIAAKLTGGSAGSIPYQTASNATSMLSTPSGLSGTYAVLTQTNSGSTPVWRELQNFWQINGNVSQNIQTQVNGTGTIVSVGLVSSPTFAGVPKATTMPSTTANTALATCEFINGNIARNSAGARIVSNAAPSGGADGDIWYRI